MSHEAVQVLFSIRFGYVQLLTFPIEDLYFWDKEIVLHPGPDLQPYSRLQTMFHYNLNIQVNKCLKPNLYTLFAKQN